MQDNLWVFKSVLDYVSVIYDRQHSSISKFHLDPKSDDSGPLIDVDM